MGNLCFSCNNIGEFDKPNVKDNTKNKKHRDVYHLYDHLNPQQYSDSSDDSSLGEYHMDNASGYDLSSSEDNYCSEDEDYYSKYITFR